MNIQYPCFWVNFKIYPKTSGQNALAVARTMDQVRSKTGAEFLLSPQIPDIRLVSNNTQLKVVAQRADAAEPGRGNGNLLIENLKKAGADAVVINHAEDRDEFSNVRKKVNRCKEVGLDSMVCVDSIVMGKAAAEFDPDTLVFEKPDDIATSKSITQTHPERVKKFIQAISRVNPQIKVLLGGGISDAKDVQLGLDQGADAAGSASAVVFSENKKSLLTEIGNTIS